MAPQTGSWSFSWSSPTSLDVPWTWPDVRFATWQLEPVAESTLLRGFVRFNRHKRLGAVTALLPGATWLPCANLVRHEYQRELSEATPLEGPWVIGKDYALPPNPITTSLPLAIAMLRDGRNVAAVLDRYPQLADKTLHLQAYSAQLVREANKENETPNAKRSRRHRG